MCHWRTSSNKLEQKQPAAVNIAVMMQQLPRPAAIRFHLANATPGTPEAMEIVAPVPRAHTKTM